MSEQETVTQEEFYRVWRQRKCGTCRWWKDSHPDGHAVSRMGDCRLANHAFFYSMLVIAPVHVAGDPKPYLATPACFGCVGWLSKEPSGQEEGEWNWEQSGLGKETT